MPIVGKWQPGQLDDTVGIFRPSNASVFLRYTNTTGTANLRFTYGVAGDQIVVGDWTGKGYDSVGIYRSGSFMLRNSNSTGPSNMSFTLGISGDVPLTGPWIVQPSV